QWKLAGTTALAALVAGNAALADVTPEQVWENWKGLVTSYGQTLTTENETRSGDTLVIGGVVMLSEQDGARAEVAIDQITLRDAGDGSVQITMSDDYQMTMNIPNEGEEKPTAITVSISNPDLSVRASGSADEARYDYTAPEISIALDSVDGVDAKTLGIDVSVTLNGSEGNSIVSGTGNTSMSTNFGATAMAVLANFVDPEGKSTLKGSVSLADLAVISTGSLPGGTNLSDMAAALNAGFVTEGAMTYGKTTFAFDFAEGVQTAQGQGAAESGSLNFAMNKSRLAYGGGAKTVAVTVSGSDIPFPEVAFGYAESAFNFLMPVSKSDAPEDFALMSKIVGLTISDDIWGLFDPAAVLPRDPVTLIIDTKGKGKLGVDLLDQQAMAALGDTPPGELYALDLSELKLIVAGAEVTGSGALTFDNSDKVSFEGLPAPTGTVTMNASGLNGLIDKLVQMGLMPEDQLAGMRMMLGMFAKPGGGADTLTSTLEFKNGGFFANGMQLK
ncbi:MAG: DUF2125 domain-containing protein, partial [Paracoccaceae bacterium]|nr:DUF2125 domain-containing protein [Paracoccaceae bacterium]